MSRPIRVEIDDDGAAQLRMRVPSRTWQAISSYASKIGVGPEIAARIFLEQIDALISAGTVAWLSADWQSAARGQKPAPPIDFSRLHRSERTKSGYVGVYANGAGFRAVGRAGAYIGTYQTAEVAAWERYLHYQRNDLPYGDLEIAVDELRKQGEQGTDAELREIALDTARKSGTLHLYDGQGSIQMAGFGPGEATEADAALRLHDVKTEQASPGRSISRRKAP